MKRHKMEPRAQIIIIIQEGKPQSLYVELTVSSFSASTSKHFSSFFWPKAFNSFMAAFMFFFRSPQIHLNVQRVQPENNKPVATAEDKEVRSSVTCTDIWKI